MKRTRWIVCKAGYTDSLDRPMYVAFDRVESQNYQETEGVVRFFGSRDEAQRQVDTLNREQEERFPDPPPCAGCGQYLARLSVVDLLEFLGRADYACSKDYFYGCGACRRVWTCELPNASLGREWVVPGDNPHSLAAEIHEWVLGLIDEGVDEAKHPVE